MSDEKNKVSDKAGEIARNIWLAGVGAYGKAVEDAQDRLEKAGVEPPKLFKELVKAGTALEKEAETPSQRRSATTSVEERINRVRDSFGIQRFGLGDDVAALHRKVDELSEKIDALTSALHDAGITDTRAPRKQTAGASKVKAKAASTAGAKSKAKTKAKTKAAANTKAPAKKARAKATTTAKKPAKAKSGTARRKPTTKA